MYSVYLLKNSQIQIHLTLYTTSEILLYKKYLKFCIIIL